MKRNQYLKCAGSKPVLIVQCCKRRPFRYDAVYLYSLKKKHRTLSHCIALVFVHMCRGLYVRENRLKKKLVIFIFLNTCV